MKKIQNLSWFIYLLIGAGVGYILRQENSTLNEALVSIFFVTGVTYSIKIGIIDKIME